MTNASKDRIICATAAIFAVAVQTLWLFTNTSLPPADAVGHLKSAIIIARNFRTADWWTAISSIYWIRDWRPTGYYLLEIPFTLLFGGSLTLSPAATTLFCTLITCFYLYYLLRLALPSTQALVGTIFLGVLPGVQWPATLYGFSETALLPAVLAAVYHLIQSWNLSKLGHTVAFSLAVGLAVIIRPTEGFTYLVLTLVTCLGVGLYRREFSWRQTYWIIAGTLVAVAALIVAGATAGGVTSHSPIFQDQADPGRGALFTRASLGFLILTAIVLAGPSISQAAVWAWRGGRLRPLYRNWILSDLSDRCTFLHRFHTAAY